MPSRTLRLTLGVCLALFSFLGRANAQWHPSGLQNWQWQLTTPVDTSLNVPVFDIDGFSNDASVVSTLHAKGAKVICYIDVGSYENFRPDQASFPASVKGASNGWPGEQWLDIRQISVLAPILTARFQMCKSKGFDAIEPDNVDGYSNSTGFPLTAADQINFNTWVATTVHGLGLSVGLKNDIEQIPQLLSKFDWALDEQCHEFSECSALDPFVSAGKTVFITEYTAFNQSICTSSNAAGYSTIFKDLNLTAPVHSCVTGGSTPPSDTTPPTVPTGLSASPTSSSSIALSWTASTDNTAVTGYRIARAGVVVGTSTATNFTNTGLSSGTAYTYTVAALDAAGNVSGFSASASATTSTNTGAPKILSFAAVPVTISAGGNSTLSWNVSGATTISISGIGTVTGTSKTVAPTATTTYLLTATNASGSATASTTVTIISGGGGGGGGGTTGPGITSFTANPAAISSGQSSTLSWVVPGTGSPNTHKFLIYYGIPATINGSTSTAAAAAVFAGYDTIVLGDGLEDPSSLQHASTVLVISALKALKPTVQIYGYVDIGVTTQNNPLATITTKISQWDTTGATGIFLDDAGYDFHTSRARQNQAIDAVHAVCLKVIENSFVPADTLGFSVDATYNPTGTHTHLTAGDGYILESWVVNTGAYSGGWETASDVKTRADSTQAFRAALGISVYADGSVDWSTTSAAQQSVYFQVFEAASAIFSWDGYGLNTYQFSATAPNSDVVKAKPYSASYNGAFSPGAAYTYDSGTATYTRGAITARLSSPQGGTLPGSVTATLSIDQGVGTVTGTSVSVSPMFTTAYTLSVTTSAGTSTATTTVSVDGVNTPIISTFTASPNPVLSGQPATLSWSVSNATSLSIDHSVGTVTGSSVSVSPHVPTTYTLTATNAAGSSTASVTLHVTIIGGPGTPRPPAWPTRNCSFADVYKQADRPTNTLATAITATDTTIMLTSPSGFSVYQVARVDSEMMLICATSGSTLTICPGTRGFAGTTASAHPQDDYISGPIAAVYHNQLVTELVALEASLWGHAGSTISGPGPVTAGASWPNSQVTAAQLIFTSDAAQSLLQSAVTASDTLIRLTAPSSFLNNSIAGIDFELMNICTASPSALTVCPGGRGFASTTAAAHNANATVVGVIAAYHHNRIAAEIASLEADLFPTLGGGTAYPGASWPNHAATTTELMVAAHGSITADYHNRLAVELIALEASLFGRVP